MAGAVASWLEFLDASPNTTNFAGVWGSHPTPRIEAGYSQIRFQSSDNGSELLCLGAGYNQFGAFATGSHIMNWSVEMDEPTTNDEKKPFADGMFYGDQRMGGCRARFEVMVRSQASGTQTRIERTLRIVNIFKQAWRWGGDVSTAYGKSVGLTQI